MSGNGGAPGTAAGPIRNQIPGDQAQRALAAGESPEWVARTLGHVNTSMVYQTYGRYIPNLTRQDGSAFEALLSGA